MKIEVIVNGTEPLVDALNALTEALSRTSLTTEDKPIKEKAASKQVEKIKAVSETPAVISLEEVRAKLAALSQDGKQAQVKELITEFGAKKLSDIPAEKYPELLQKAEVL